MPVDVHHQGRTFPGGCSAPPVAVISHRGYVTLFDDIKPKRFLETRV
jgi:hypothetical protein